MWKNSPSVKATYQKWNFGSVFFLCWRASNLSSSRPKMPYLGFSVCGLKPFGLTNFSGPIGRWPRLSMLLLWRYAIVIRRSSVILVVQIQYRLNRKDQTWLTVEPSTVRFNLCTFKSMHYYITIRIGECGMSRMIFLFFILVFHTKKTSYESIFGRFFLAPIVNKKNIIKMTCGMSNDEIIQNKLF